MCIRNLWPTECIYSENLPWRRFFFIITVRSWNRFICTITGARDGCPISGRCKKFSFPPKRPDMFCFTFIILFGGYLRLLFRGKRIATWRWPPTLDPLCAEINTLTYVWQFSYAFTACTSQVCRHDSVWLQHLILAENVEQAAESGFMLTL